MKKSVKKAVGIAVGAVVLLAVVFVYYYITLPAVNIHAAGFWFFLMGLVAIAFVATAAVKALRRARSHQAGPEGPFKMRWKQEKLLCALAALFLLVLVTYFVGSLLSSPIVNAKRYQRLLTVEEREFTSDIKEVDYNTIPLLDKESAALLGDRKMGSLVEMVSQFEVADDYTQINYRGKPVRVTPLVYASPIKWLTNRKNGIPAYIRIDMTTQDTECVMLDQGIRYSKSEYFNRNLYRHLRFHYPTYIFDDQLFFEIDEEGTPYWVCPVKKFNIGLFGGQTVGRVVLCNAVTGECVDYAVEDVPQWVDKVFSAELLISLYDYHGVLVHGFFNSILGQRDCLTTTEGYNYIALDDDVWVYTGLTSVNGDQSNVGFVLMNQRTMEARTYVVEGATETSAMSSAEGQVQNLGYRATFPLLLNIAGEPTYFVALKDGAGLVKKYAMINIQKYQWVAIGDTIQECERNYSSLLSTNGIVREETQNQKEAAGEIEVIAPVVIEGNTHYYIGLKEYPEDLFDVDLTRDDLKGIVRYAAGDRIRLTYGEGYGLHPVYGIQGSDEDGRDV